MKPRMTRMYSAGLVCNNFPWEIVAPAMRRAVGTRGGGRMAVPRLAPWDGMRRRVATGGERLRRGFGSFVICHLVFVIGERGAFSSAIHHLRSSIIFAPLASLR